MPFEIGELNEWYANIDRVGAENSLDLYQFSRSEAGSFTIGVRSLSAPVSVEILDNLGNVLSAVNASKENGGSLFFEHDSTEDYLLKISSIGGDTPYQVSISPDGESDPITEWGITEGFFVADATGEVGVHYLFDGGKYQGELAIFSLKGMESKSLGSEEFITEAASRAMSNSTLGHVVIYDSLEGAKLSSGENSGEYLGRETFSMEPGDVFAAMLVPNGTVQEVYENPEIGGNKRPLFSLATANPDDAFHVGQVGNITGSGSAFAIEDLRVDAGSDKDYNDIIWQFSGAVGLATTVAIPIMAGKNTA